MIGIVDYGMGNLRSVFNALTFLDCQASFVTTPAQIKSCDHLILPGVGAYAKAMSNLTAAGLIPVIQEYAKAKKPLLGICLGMQLLSSRGTEPYPCNGLDLISGDVNILCPPSGFELPHVGWNTIELARPHPVFNGVKHLSDFYFVHSYHFIPSQPNDGLTMTDYGQRFVSTVARNNILGVQFHPEKSQDNGLKILENFSRWDGTC